VAPCRFPPITLGPVRAAPIALASSYGIGAREVDRAFERGLSSFFWGALRRADFGRALRRLARRRREDVTIAIQTFARRPWLVRPSVDLARLRLGVEAIDVLGLGFWNEPPPRAIVDAALRLRDRGVVRSVVVSSHDRVTLATLIDDPALDGVMVRYNAAHTGAERDVFPLAVARRRPVLAYTATRWGTLVAPGAAPDGDRLPRATDCYRFALTHPAVGACLAGPKDARELDEVLAALDEGPMTESEVAWMRRVGAHVRRVVAREGDRARAVGARDHRGHPEPLQPLRPPAS
jgi:aryl-alcohol dehydrogenase-like predicted oxidoreductase